MSVVIVRDEVNGNTEPRFIIRQTDLNGNNAVYFLPLAVWEFDESQATNPQQVQGCTDIANEFTAAQAIGQGANFILTVVKLGGPPFGGGGDGNQTSPD
jgi:hypothetical protein